jgi:hypothetical protein
LVKSVLEAIPLFWPTLAYISQGILERNRKKVFRFLWTEKKQTEGIPLVKWKAIAKPKEEGGWVLKNIYYFGKSLAAKK